MSTSSATPTTKTTKAAKPLKVKAVRKDGNTIIQSSNGISTWTGQTLKHPVKIYDTYNEVGVNEELMRDVMNQIETNQFLWGQGAWRAVVDMGSKSALAKAAKSLAAFKIEATAPVCSTPMCVAGWATELASADWVVDATIIKAVTDKENKDPYFTLKDINHWIAAVFVTKTWLEDRGEEARIRMGLDDQFTKTWLAAMPEKMQDIIAERGFTKENHGVIEASSYAKVRLGIGNDPLDMFSGDSTLPYLRYCASTYIDEGADMTREKASDLRHHFTYSSWQEPVFV